MTASPPAMLRFGSLHGRCHSARQEYTDALALVFGVGLHPLTHDADCARQFELSIERSAVPERGAVTTGRHVSHLTLGGTSRQPTIATDVLRAELELEPQPVQIRIFVLADPVPFDALCVHFVAVIHKILSHLDRVILHAAAVELDGEVSIFMGDKGAGKSTTCLALARSGATVLGEDQLILRRVDDRYLVSGGDERSRVTAETERHFFAEPLAVPARDFAGTMKKEVRMGDFFRSAPFRDFTAHRLVFPMVTGRFDLRRLKARPALLRVMGYNAHFQRFAGAKDQGGFLDFLAGFIETVTCWELSLSHDLTDLDQLADRLRSG